MGVPGQHEIRRRIEAHEDAQRPLRRELARLRWRAKRAGRFTTRDRLLARAADLEQQIARLPEELLRAWEA